MRRRMIVSILIGLTLILSTFISTVSIVQKMAYAQARMEPSNNGVPVLNSMNQRSTVVGSNTEPGRNLGVQGIAGALSSDGRTIANGPQTFTPGTHLINVFHKIITASAVVSFLLAGYAIIEHHRKKQQGQSELPHIVTGIP
jgi:hypothetical protein